METVGEINLLKGAVLKVFIDCCFDYLAVEVVI